MRFLLASTALLLATTGCAAFTNEAPAGKKGLDVVTAFYPLQFVAQQVAGGHAKVVDLTKPGSEPHDLELSVAQTAEVVTADVVVYEKGLQAAVDAAVGQASGVPVVDAGAVAGLEPISHGGHDDAGHDSPGSVEPSDLGDLDPHFWQDPLKLAKVVDAVADALAKVDPDHADDVRANAAALDAELDRSTTTTRRAAGLRAGHGRRLARRVRLPGAVTASTVEPIAGLSPDAEPTPADLARLQKLIETDGITTVFSERLVEPASCSETPGRRHGRAHRGARPDRGAERGDGRRGLPVPDAREPRCAARRRTDARHERRRPGRARPTARSRSAAGRSCAAST